MDTRRLFIAVEVPEEIRERISSAADGLRGLGFGLVDKKNMHITLLFIGDVDVSRIDAIKGVMDNLDRQGFRIALQGMGSFSERNPGVIFIRLSEGSDDAAAISSYLKESVGDLGLATDERDFTAHLTIGRLKHHGASDKITGFIKLHSNDEFGSFECGRIVLVESVLSGNGPKYSELHAKVLV